MKTNCRIQFNIKMLTPLDSSSDEQSILSPKQTQQRHKRALTLRKIDAQIDQILNLNSQQHSQYQEYINKISYIQQHYKQQTSLLQQQLSKINDRYLCLEAMYFSLKDELQQVCTAHEKEGVKSYKLELTNQQLNKDINKLKNMVGNQENLIDQYRKRIEEEIILEKQFMQAEFQQQKAKIQMDFNRALIQMEKQFQDKLKKTLRKGQVKDYKVEFKELKKYISMSRQVSEKDLNIAEIRQQKPINSEYSTSDQQNRHNQHIFNL